MSGSILRGFCSCCEPEPATAPLQPIMMYLAKLYAVIAVLAALEGVVSQTPEPTRPITSSVGAPPGGDLSLDNFQYQYGNTANLAGPAVYSDGLNKGQVAGIVIGCVLFGLLVGALGMLCWVKRKRLFPQKYGPCEHPHEAPSVGPIDVLRTGSKLDTLHKHELVSVKSFTNSRV